MVWTDDLKSYDGITQVASYPVDFDPKAPIDFTDCATYIGKASVACWNENPTLSFHGKDDKIILTITTDSITVDPDCKVDEAAQAVLDLVLQGIITNETIRKAKAYDRIKEFEKNFKIEPTPLTPEETLDIEWD